MTVKTYAPGLSLEQENGKFFWRKDGRVSEGFDSKEEAIKALKDRKLHYHDVVTV